jgi:hypothetical protein
VQGCARGARLRGGRGVGGKGVGLLPLSLPLVVRDETVPALGACELPPSGRVQGALMRHRRYDSAWGQPEPGGVRYS